MSKPKLLFLCQTLPYPPDGGAPIRSFNLLRLLARDFDVTALCFYRVSTTIDIAGSMAALRSIASVVEVYAIEQEHRKWRLLWDHLRSLLTMRAYTDYAYESAAFRRSLLGHLRTTRFAVVHVDSLDLGGYLSLFEGVPIVLGHHNVESMLLERRAKNESNGIRRGYLRVQSTFLRREERLWASRVAVNLVVSDGDAQNLAALVPGARIAVIPNGVDIETFAPEDSSKSDGIVFVGGMSWFPNADALTFFDEEVLPHIRAVDPLVKVTWIGRATPEAIERFARRSIHLTGYVDDFREFVHDASCYVVPLRIGGGTRLKILDAWAMGKAIVSTSVGCEGLDAVDGHNILIRDDPKEFAAAVTTVLREPGLRASLASNARVTAVEKYSWEVIGRALRSAYAPIGAAAPRSD
ncbi:MAG: glycosyltransferase family 4 protein [Gemmatimonadaceae bacterium]